MRGCVPVQDRLYPLQRDPQPGNLGQQIRNVCAGSGDKCGVGIEEPCSLELLGSEAKRDVAVWVPWAY